jgi:hypothetical protein
MGKKKDCFGQEDYVCMTRNCPYARECINEVWKARLDRVLAKRNKPQPRRRSRSRLTVDG